MSDKTSFYRFENGKIQVILLFVCPKTIDITEFLKKCCIAIRTKLRSSELKLHGRKGSDFHLRRKRRDKSGEAFYETGFM